MLFLLFGSSCAGKSSALAALRDRALRLALHDFDEIDVPPGADTTWRQGAVEHWLGRGLAYQSEGIDLVLAGQTPFGELLAAPSAPRFDAISACLLDCDDVTRAARMRARGPAWLERVGGDPQSFLNWAAWMRVHAADPTWAPVVITRSDADMRWERWTSWAPGDERWNVHSIDTTGLTVEQLGDALAGWIARERERFERGAHPLAGEAWAVPA